MYIPSGYMQRDHSHKNTSTTNIHHIIISFKCISKCLEAKQQPKEEKKTPKNFSFTISSIFDKELPILCWEIDLDHLEPVLQSVCNGKRKYNHKLNTKLLIWCLPKSKQRGLFIITTNEYNNNTKWQQARPIMNENLMEGVQAWHTHTHSYHIMDNCKPHTNWIFSNP